MNERDRELNLARRQTCLGFVKDQTLFNWIQSPANLRQKIFEPRHDKTNKMSVCPAKTQISLGICPVWSESSLCTQWVAKDPRFLHADSEDSDQTGQMPRLIWVFAGCTHILLVLSCRCSFVTVSLQFPVILLSDSSQKLGSEGNWWKKAAAVF